MSTYRFALADEHFLFHDDNHFTYTSTEQKRIEDLCKFEHERYLHGYLDDLEEKKPSGPVLHRNAHIKYALKCLDHLSENYMTMDASRAWFCFWGLHSLRLLGHKIDLKLETRIIRFLEMCQHPDGGYGGAPGQFPHLATTYAAVMALISLGTDEAFNSIDREKLYAFLTRVKHVDGGFVLHEGGERDIRGAYCAISVAMILNIGDEKLFDKTAEWIVGCQTYEGGFGGEHNCEAHGGYTFCGVAGLALLRKSHLLNIPSLLKWLVNKQMCYEGGFQGRTNKLVDACYSFWQAATFFTIEYELSKEAVNPIRGLFNEEALQQYLLICCQDIKNGGLRDKPEKNPDLYHTCYGLAGLAIAQSYSTKKTEIVGGEKNALNDVHPLYNVCMDVEQKAKSFFSQSSGDN